MMDQDSSSRSTDSPAVSMHTDGSPVIPADFTLAADGELSHELAQHPPAKTDKPRPHVCASCSRAFARLEHLKRHERSHTKEKPFACPECARCFARRDLLLRHQQKLHYATNPAARPRGTRRGSASTTNSAGPAGGSATSARVRKNSMATSNAACSMPFGIPAKARPRANTIGHLDLASLGLADDDPVSATTQPQIRPYLADMSQRHRMSEGDLPIAMMPQPGYPASLSHLPKLRTHSVDTGYTGALRSAPAGSQYRNYSFDHFYSPHAINTVNPAELHFPATLDSPVTPFVDSARFENAMGTGEEVPWPQMWATPILDPNNMDESAIDDSLALRQTYSNPLGHPDSMPTIETDQMCQNWPLSNSAPSAMLQAFQLGQNPSSGGPISQGVSPMNLHQPVTINTDVTSIMSNIGSSFYGQQNQHYYEGSNSVPTYISPSAASNTSSDTPSASSSMNDSARHSSVTSISCASITDATRQLLLSSLSKPSMYGHSQRQGSLTLTGSPLSPSTAARSASILPPTSDLQRYISAYIQHFHPHLPFLHIPSLCFEEPEYGRAFHYSESQVSYNSGSHSSGDGCLVLAMAAIGALFEYDHVASKDLFDSAKRMIQLYLEGRRKSDLVASMNGSHTSGLPQNTPLWLIQAMLLNVIYGHNCGDQTSADIASTHCAALVSLTRAAELARGQPQAIDIPATINEEDVKTNGVHDAFVAHDITPDAAIHARWCRWREAEERKRTLFAVFVMSSLLVTGYNHPPALMNSEILLDLPCEEELWAADTGAEWNARGGSQIANQRCLPFASALNTLLTPSRRSSRENALFGQPPSRAIHVGAESDIRPSSFGCLILINAIHNYIWETRNRHLGRQWTALESDAMVTNIEGALHAWHDAWRANELHHVDRPNPFGLGPLSSDSIPLLDLAFVRLHVNLARTKEAFWQQDFEAMAEEFATGTEIVQHADASRENSQGPFPSHASDTSDRSLPGDMSLSAFGQASIRERQLRKAACHAADALTKATQHNLTYADALGHELPLQSAMCLFDSSQVLAEWIAMVQSRVGNIYGIVGKGGLNLAQLSANVLLDSADVELLHRSEIISSVLEAKIVQQANLLSITLGSFGADACPSPLDSVALGQCGLGSRLLRVTACMLERAAVWPVMRTMSIALDIQASHMDRRAQASIAIHALNM